MPYLGIDDAYGEIERRQWGKVVVGGTPNLVRTWVVYFLFPLDDICSLHLLTPLEVPTVARIRLVTSRQHV